MLKCARRPSVQTPTVGAAAWPLASQRALSWLRQQAVGRQRPALIFSLDGKGSSSPPSPIFPRIWIHVINHSLRWMSRLALLRIASRFSVVFFIFFKATYNTLFGTWRRIPLLCCGLHNMQFSGVIDGGCGYPPLELSVFFIGHRVNVLITRLRKLNLTSY